MTSNKLYHHDAAMYNKEEFLQHYMELEQWAKDSSYTDIKGLEYSEEKESLRNDLYFYRHIRNFISHNSRAKERLEFTVAFKDDFDALCKHYMRDKSELVISKIYKRQMGDAVLPTIKYMREQVYTHVPIMNGKKVWGVFSENTLFEIAAEGGFSAINEQATFLTIRKNIVVNDKSCDGVYDFIGRSASLEDIKKKFADARDERRQLEVLFITTDGTPNGDLNGLITIWDLTTT